MRRREPRPHGGREEAEAAVAAAVTAQKSADGAGSESSAARVGQRRAEERCSAANADVTITVDDAREALWVTRCAIAAG